MYAVYNQFYPFLYLFIASIFPKRFQVGDDGFSKRDDLIAYGAIDFFIGVINEV